MSLSRGEFEKHWQNLGENQAMHAVDAAWRRYQRVQDWSYTTTSEESDTSTQDFRDGFTNFFAHVTNAITEYEFITVDASRIPWAPTGIRPKQNQMVSTFASGRVWRSRDLDMFLRPQFALWYKLGVNGTVFNSTRDTNTFKCVQNGELYVANQFPGQFGEPTGGRLASQLSAYEKAEGRFEVLIIVWKEGVNVSGILEPVLSHSEGSPYDLVKQELQRIRNDAHPSVPAEWQHLWFIGKSSSCSLENLDSEPCMHCKPYLNTTILQRNLLPPIAFTPDVKVSWDWNITALPSRLREDLTFTHDYLSVAFEFENGRDLTYLWSWELPEGFGFWCPLPTWSDREYHVVVRSGTARLGEWLSEERNLYDDYVQYVEGGKEDLTKVPKQVVRAWFIAGNRWQRSEGEMRVKQLQIAHKAGCVKLLE